VRIGELLGLRLTDVTFDTAQIKLMGKGARERFAYMSSTVYRVLFKYLHRWRPQVPSQYFFIHGNGQPLTRFYAAHRLQSYGKRAKIAGIRCSPHTLRHSFAVNYLRLGGDSFTLQRILGHSTLEMTRHYTEVSNSDVELKEKKFSPAERLRLKD
jgi:integrase/recombinase XerD